MIWLDAYAVPVTGVLPGSGGAAAAATVRGVEHVTLLGATVPCRRAAVGDGVIRATGRDACR